ncbi:MAG: hypothetical protein JXO72_02845 [Vicinamibacteria bacterium]|nr:hypothetical protein [Vicinamibacteria bacterium]
MEIASKASLSSEYARTLGVWSSFLAAFLSLSFAVLAVLFSPPEWEGMESYAKDMNFLQMANMIPVILLTFAIVVVMSCVYSLAPESKRVFGLIAVAFSSAYAAIISTNYYLQLFVVRLNASSGDWEGLSLLAMPNLHSAFFALETIGYAFLSVGTLFVVPILTDGKLENWIKAFLILSSSLGLFGALVAPLDQPALIFAGLGIWSLTFPIAMALLGFYFLGIKNGR